MFIICLAFFFWQVGRLQEIADDLLHLAQGQRVTIESLYQELGNTNYSLNVCLENASSQSEEIGFLQEQYSNLSTTLLSCDFSLMQCESSKHLPEFFNLTKSFAEGHAGWYRAGNYSCVNYSNDLATVLKENGYSAWSAVGTAPGVDGCHEWVKVLVNVEPQTGEVVKNYAQGACR